MQRSPELAPLSREHHVALAVALRLRRAREEDLGDAVARFASFFAGHGAAHFAIEEEVLLAELPEPMRRRLAAEHAGLRRRADRLAERPGVGAARALGEALAAHVRFEEREVFPLLEQRLSSGRLAEVGALLAA